MSCKWGQACSVCSKGVLGVPHGPSGCHQSPFPTKISGSWNFWVVHHLRSVTLEGTNLSPNWTLFPGKWSPIVLVERDLKIAVYSIRLFAECFLICSHSIFMYIYVLNELGATCAAGADEEAIHISYAPFWGQIEFKGERLKDPLQDTIVLPIVKHNYN